MSQTPGHEVLKTVRRAVSRIRSYGVDGPRPIEEIEALLELEDQIDEALRTTLLDAGGDDVVAAIHLVSLMRRVGALDAVREVAFERPTEMEAKREAVEALRRCGEEPAAEIVAKLAAVDALAATPDAGALATLLEWPVAWRRPALDAWLEAAGVGGLASVEIAIGIDADLDARLLDWVAALGTAESAEVLQRFLAAATDKERRKQVKKALHRLRAQGVEVAEPESDHGSAGFSLAIDSKTFDDARAHVTSVDGSGARLVWILWRAAGGGARLLQAVVDDSTGLREAEVATVTRSGFREYVERMRANPAVMLAQVPVQRAAAILADAAAHSEASGQSLPEAYEGWAELAGVEPTPAAAAEIYEHVAATDVGADESLIEASMVQLREPYFQSWALEGAVIDDAAENIHEAETSTLMISDEQRRERMQDAIRDALVASFDEATRRRYRRRLEIMAGMLWERGKQEEARQLVAAAIGLTEIEDLFRRHAFARAVVHRGVWLAYQDKQRELVAEQQRSGIVRP